MRDWAPASRRKHGPLDVEILRTIEKLNHSTLEDVASDNSRL